MALRGIRVVEMAGLAPAPFCGMILSDFGAKVIRVDRPNAPHVDQLARGKQSIVVNLKKAEGAKVVERICRSADVLLEPYRPGVMEKLGLGPDTLLEENPRLIYARLSGFGQSGPLASSAGHDINYIAISGLLSLLGRKGERPYPPINLLADFAGGGLLCALGIVMSLLERQTSGRGQVVDANMVHGSAYLGSWMWKSRDLPGVWQGDRGENLLDGGAAFYDVYETQDGKYMSVGALEPQFFQGLLQGLNLDPTQISQMNDQTELRRRFQEIFKMRTKSEWTEIFSKLDACVQPVLELDEAPHHPHNWFSNNFIQDKDTGTPEPAPAPRLSRTPGVAEVLPQPLPGQDTVTVLKESGLDKDEVSRLLKEGVVMENKEKSKL
ncbi:alpha-methylacyl-CoA racemase-like [Littorina saxatilis]|uniref:Alpha-methylacyl-CoA racemase n=1 Tax=Littorina saxatilis TaxID=31220 RepID=A0AAN9GP30_9CAEN